MYLMSQRDPRWSGHVLGFGPSLGTIGAYGCYLTDMAMICWDAFGDMHYTPDKLDEVLTARKIFLRDSTGTYDLLPDIALSQVWPDRWVESHQDAFRGDLVDAAIPTPDTYAVFWIATASVPTHFVIAASKGPNYQIIDPWTGKIGLLSGYGGPAAVHKTILFKAKKPVPVVVPPVIPPVVVPPVIIPPPVLDWDAVEAANALRKPQPLPLPTPPPPGKYGCLGLAAALLNGGS